jgi:hypothetical protein
VLVVGVGNARDDVGVDLGLDAVAEHPRVKDGGSPRKEEENAAELGEGVIGLLEEVAYPSDGVILTRDGEGRNESPGAHSGDDVKVRSLELRGVRLAPAVEDAGAEGAVLTTAGEEEDVDFGGDIKPTIKVGLVDRLKTSQKGPSETIALVEGSLLVLGDLRPELVLADGTAGSGAGGEGAEQDRREDGESSRSASGSMVVAVHSFSRPV